MLVDLHFRKGGEVVEKESTKSKPCWDNQGEGAKFWEKV